MKNQPKEILEWELRDIIIESTKPGGKYGSQVALARAMNISKQYLNDIILRQKPISNKVAKFFGYRLEKRYIREDRGVA